MDRKHSATILGLILATSWISRAAADGPSVNYSRDIKPILAAHCYACHGPDEGRRKAKLRLDERQAALKKAIKAGDPAHSPLLERIRSDDPEEVMPPPSNKRAKLTAEQIDLLTRWIEQGAKFDTHWAYVKPIRPPLPTVKNRAWPRNPLDLFVAAKHERLGYSPVAEADRVTLLRRLHFDLIGLPPMPDEVDAFVNDTSAKAYEKAVDRLLASPHFGERMAVYWLDLVRYADTGGYHSDNHRDVALYRDWVIHAFNENKPFDQFTLEQLAGDLLPNPTIEQKIASGYNRLLQTTEEGGAQPKEYTAKYAADRVRNASSVWLATTLACCECHNHKFDPFTSKDFYSLGAFFADVKEAAVGRQQQTLMPTPEQKAQLDRLDRDIAALRAEMAKPTLAVEVGRSAWEERMRKTPANLPGPIAAILKVEPEKRTPQQRESVAAHYRTLAPELTAVREQIAAMEKRKKELVDAVPKTLVTEAASPRVMRVLPRGNWLDDSGQIVAPAVPAILPALEVTGRRANRLDLARWFVSQDNPLTARVFVNRLWKIAFGRGLVASLEDFGTQGDYPTHPQLLDWLAVEFMTPSPLPSPPGGGEGRVRGWDIKHLLKLMVMSNTYRQSSFADADLRRRDPNNLWLARQGRFRLDAEMVRDNALAISGLLSSKIGGPSVKPYQPVGYWKHLNFPTREYYPDHGDNQYRRGLYTYWQRTFLHPSLKAFDAPTREECTVERPRSSTPLQALVLLNDPSYVEAARVLAERTITEGGKTPADRLNWAFRRAVSRNVKAEEANLLLGLYAKHKAEFTKDAPAARKLVTTGERALPANLDVVELAAWTSVARVILNLHETITRN
jgi:mono/diheme cytochrome c family protein